MCIRDRYKRETGNEDLFSEQQLVDCDTSNWGCSGGWPHNALYYTMINGIAPSARYAYTGTDDQCKYQDDWRAYTPYTYKWVPGYDGAALKAAVNESVIVVTLFADPIQYYSSGIFNGACGGQNDHAVTMVGYGSEDGQDYWRIRNSWGSWWGEKGYFRLARSDDKGDGQCGINEYGVYPVSS